MKSTPSLLAAILFIVMPFAFADVTVVIPAQNSTDQTTTTSETYVQPVQPYIGAVVPVGAAAVYGTGVNGERRANQFNNLNNQFDHKAGAGRADGRGAAERGGRR